jgi:hypothetical protein
MQFQIRGRSDFMKNESSEMWRMPLLSVGKVAPGFVGREKCLAAEDPLCRVVPFAVDEETCEYTGMVLLPVAVVLIGSASGCPSLFCSLHVGVVNQKGVLIRKRLSSDWCWL